MGRRKFGDRERADRSQLVEGCGMEKKHWRMFHPYMEACFLHHLESWYRNE